MSKKRSKVSTKVSPSDPTHDLIYLSYLKGFSALQLASEYGIPSEKVVRIVSDKAESHQGESPLAIRRRIEYGCDLIMKRCQETDFEPASVMGQYLKALEMKGQLNKIDLITPGSVSINITGVKMPEVNIEKAIADNQVQEVDSSGEV